MIFSSLQAILKLANANEAASVDLREGLGFINHLTHIYPLNYNPPDYLNALQTSHRSFATNAVPSSALGWQEIEKKR